MMPSGLGAATPEMGTAAGFHDDNGGFGGGDEASELLAVQPFPVEHPPAGSGDAKFEDILCKVDGNDLRCTHGLLLVGTFKFGD